MSTAVRIVLSAWCVVRLAALPAAFQAPAATEAASAKTWIGHEKEIEEDLKTAEVVKMSNTSVVVTKPRHTYLAAGGTVSEMAWKVLPPGRQGGFHESYKAEIAAYELDKVLKLEMVPPKVERTIGKEVGVAVMW